MDYENYRYVDGSFKELLGQTLTEVNISEDKTEVQFKSAYYSWVLYHSQDCCELVSIDDVVGDINDLIGNPLLLVEESTNRLDAEKEGEYTSDSYTWTFYRLGTIKGYVTIKWYGESNGYYSESVDFAQEFPLSKEAIAKKKAEREKARKDYMKQSPFYGIGSMGRLPEVVVKAIENKDDTGNS